MILTSRGLEIFFKKKYLLTIIYLVVLALGAFFRFYSLDTIPFGLYSDEAFNGTEALLSLLNNDYQVFYLNNGGREGLFVWLISISQIFMTPSIISLRIVPSFIGLLTVLTVPFMLFYVTLFLRDDDSESIKSFVLVACLASMFFLACNYWHINFSRIVFRGILDPLFSTLSVLTICLYFIKPEKKSLAILSGVVCSLGVYGYGSYKFMIFPLFFLIFCALSSFQNRKDTVLLFSASAALVLLPFLLFIIENPGAYFFRLSKISIFGMDSPLTEFCRSIIGLFMMLFLSGDPNPRHNLGSNPQLHPLVFIFFAIGSLHMIMKLIKKQPVEEKKIQISFELSRKMSLFFLVWWISMIIPSALTFEGQPHSLRGIGMIIPTLSIAGLGVALFANFLKEISSKISKRVITIIVLPVCFLLFYTTYLDYFNRFPKSPHYMDVFDGRLFKQYQYIVKERNLNKIIVLDNNKSLGSTQNIQTLLFLMDYDLKTHRVEVISIDELKKHSLLNKAIILVSGNNSSQVKKIVSNKRIIVY